jgi:hypothetical protein
MAEAVNLGRDLARAFDPVLLARDCGLDPDPLQAELLTTLSRRVIVNATRQWGKSSVTALIALHECLYAAPARVVLVSPSQQQSGELFKKLHTFWTKLPGAPHARQESLTKLELANGSRVVSLPGSERTVRGFSASLIIVDEAARCPDELIHAVKPMLAASENGRLILLSTPAGRRGYFFETWEHGENWHRIRVQASECPRISPAFLDEERAALGPLLFEQEYMCAFHDADTSVFSSELIQAALTDDFEPFFPVAA